METVVQFISFPSIFNEQLQQNLIKNEKFISKYNLIEICLENEQRIFEKKNNYKTYSKLSKIKKLFYWARLNIYLISKYKELKDTIVQIQFVDYNYVRIIPFLKKISKRIILSYWGSDLLRNEKLEHMTQLFDISDVITFETNKMAEIFNNRTQSRYSSLIKYVNFGSPMIELIPNINDKSVELFKMKYGIDSEKTNVVIGYNRDKNQQHLAIIKSLRNSGIMLDDIFLIFPWTYGNNDKEYRARIEEELGSLSHVFIEEYMTDDEVACLRVLSNVLIQLQTTDCLSSSMMETLYAGNHVITGSWLPYDELESKGVSLHKISDIEATGQALEKLLKYPDNADIIERSKSAIFDILSWEENIKKWIGLYE